MNEREKFISKINLQGEIIDDNTSKIIGYDIPAVEEIKKTMQKDIDDLSIKASKYLEELYLCYEGKFKGRQRPMTPEQLAQEQAAINREYLNKIDNLQKQIETLNSKIEERGIVIK